MVFPVTINSTTIFNMGPVVGPMLSLLQQETLPDDGVAECQKVIYNLIGMENKGESLPSPLTASSTGKKSGRKEEKYRLMFYELEKFVIAHSGNSPRHHQVLECLMQVRNKPMPAKREAETELSLASRELERYQAMSGRERLPRSTWSLRVEGTWGRSPSSTSRWSLLSRRRWCEQFTMDTESCDNLYKISL